MTQMTHVFAALRQLAEEVNELRGAMTEMRDTMSTQGPGGAQTIRFVIGPQDMEQDDEEEYEPSEASSYEDERPSSAPATVSYETHWAPTLSSIFQQSD